jgi:hypothetical protein
MHEIAQHDPANMGLHGNLQALQRPRLQMQGKREAARGKVGLDAIQRLPSLAAAMGFQDFLKQRVGFHRGRPVDSLRM